MTSIVNIFIFNFQVLFLFFSGVLNINAKKCFSTNNNIIAQDTALFSYPASFTTPLHYFFNTQSEVWLLNNKNSISWSTSGQLRSTELKELWKYQKLIGMVDHNPSSHRQDKITKYWNEFLVAYHRVLSVDVNTEISVFSGTICLV